MGRATDRGDEQVVSGRVVVALSGALALCASARADVEPLDPFDPTPRQILVELEISSDVGAVGVSYGPPLPASYSTSGGIGTVVIPIESHEQMRGGSLEPIPGTFTPFVIEIHLGDLSAASQSASGALQSGGLLFGFTQNPLGTDTLAGYMSGETNVPGFCTSQQEIDDLCRIDPTYCNITCEIVPGAAYSPATGKLNLVGSESVQGCDGPFCFGPFLFFGKNGDLRLSEVAAVPALPAPGPGILAAFLLLAGLAALTGAARRQGVAAPRRAARTYRLFGSSTP